MAQFKYYYDLLSQPCRSLYIIFRMSGTPFEKNPISLLKGDHLRKAFKEINRFQRVPCIVTSDNFKLSESFAIIRYVDSLGLISKDLYPNNKNDRAIVDEYMSWHHINTRFSCVTYLTQKVLAPAARNQLFSKEDINKSLVKLNNTMDQIESIWLSDKFFLGDSLTVADIFAACEIKTLDFAGYNPGKNRPKLKKWLEDVQNASNPYFNEVHP